LIERKGKNRGGSEAVWLRVIKNWGVVLKVRAGKKWALGREKIRRDTKN